MKTYFLTVGKTDYQLGKGSAAIAMYWEMFLLFHVYPAAFIRSNLSSALNLDKFYIKIVPQVGRCGSLA